MPNKFTDRINEIRRRMDEKGIDIYFIPMDDCHNSEYVGDHFKTIEFVSGFTGSAAQIVITGDEAYLWTDGRYFLQAAEELKDSGIILMKDREEGVPTISDFLNDRLKDEKVLGFEGRVVCYDFANKLEGRMIYDVDLVGDVWKERPAQNFSDIVLFEKESGKTFPEKLSELRAELEKIGGNNYLHIINSLDDIAWLINVRGNDVEYNPVIYAYLTVSNKDVKLYTGAAITGEIKAYFDKNGITVKDYSEFQNNILSADEDDGHPVIIVDPKRISFDMYMTFKDAGYEIREMPNPTSLQKAVKNETEISNTKEAQKKDGVALVQFMKWIKENAGKETISESDVSDKLVEFRSRQEGFIEPSFATIAGYKENAAIIHYEPERGKDKQIDADGMLLVDSGGHYKEGTTDTTRTIVLGSISDEEKKCFTLVAAAMLRLLDLDSRKSKEKFKGAGGDEVARELLLENGYNYNHGTGHGIGYVLNVHEAPPSISKPREGSCDFDEFVPGMITSNEPGIYFDGRFGIRTENNMLVVEKETAEGSYMAFENLTCVPIDIDGMDPSCITEEDIQRFNAYNQWVYETLEDRLDEETKNWLKEYTKAI